MATSRIVWAKLKHGIGWWPGEVTEDFPPDVIESLKKSPLAVVKFFDADEYEPITSAKDMIDYREEKRPELIKKGLVRLKNHADENNFIKDVKEAETRTGGDPTEVDNIKKELEAPHTPKKPSYSDIFKPPPKEIPPPTPTAGIKFNFKKPTKNQSPQKRELHSTPTPQQPGPPKKYSCDICGLTSDRVGVVTAHRRSHLSADYSQVNVSTPARSSLNSSANSVAVPSSSPVKARVESPKSPSKEKPPAKKRGRKKKEQAKEDILNDWSDEEYEANIETQREEADESNVPLLKKPRTEKELSDAFEALLQSTQPTESATETKVKVEENVSDTDALIKKEPVSNDSEVKDALNKVEESKKSQKKESSDHPTLISPPEALSVGHSETSSPVTDQINPTSPVNPPKEPPATVKPKVETPEDMSEAFDAIMQSTQPPTIDKESKTKSDEKISSSPASKIGRGKRASKYLEKKAEVMQKVDKSKESLKNEETTGLKPVMPVEETKALASVPVDKCPSPVNPPCEPPAPVKSAPVEPQENFSEAFEAIMQSTRPPVLKGKGRGKKRRTRGKSKEEPQPKDSEAQFNAQNEKVEEASESQNNSSTIKDLTPKTTVTTRAKSPAKTPAKAPAKTPAKAPAKASVKAPAKTPAKTPDKTPAKTPDKTPAKVPDKTPAKVPDKTPAKIPDKTAVKISDKTLVTIPDNTAVKHSDTTPIKTPDKTSVKLPDKTPVKTPDKVSIKTLDKAPVKTPDKTPMKIPDKTPEETPAKTPNKTPLKTPAKAPTKAPVKTPVKTPAKTTAKTTEKPVVPLLQPPQTIPATQASKTPASVTLPDLPLAVKSAPTISKQPAAQVPIQIASAAKPGIVKTNPAVSKGMVPTIAKELPVAIKSAPVLSEPSKITAFQGSDSSQPSSQVINSVAVLSKELPIAVKSAPVLIETGPKKLEINRKSAAKTPVAESPHAKKEKKTPAQVDKSKGGKKPLQTYRGKKVNEVAASTRPNSVSEKGTTTSEGIITTKALSEKPTAAIKPSVANDVKRSEEDSIIRQALQGTLKSSPAEIQSMANAKQNAEAGGDAEVATTEEVNKVAEQVVHLVPVENPDGTVTYMLLSLGNQGELCIDATEGAAPTIGEDAIYVDKATDGDTFFASITQPNPPTNSLSQSAIPQRGVAAHSPAAAQVLLQNQLQGMQILQSNQQSSEVILSHRHQVEGTPLMEVSAGATDSTQNISGTSSAMLDLSSLVTQTAGTGPQIQGGSEQHQIVFLAEDGSILNAENVNWADYAGAFIN